MRQLTIVVSLLISACGVLPAAGSIEGAWELESGTYNGEPIPVVDSHPVTLTIDGDQIGGTAACNGYGGTYQISGGSFSVGGLSVTEMACMPRQVMESERLYLEALLAVNKVDVVGERLVLSGEATEMVFTELPPVPTAELVGTVWVLEGLVQGDAVSSVSGERATLELSADGSFTGSTGCRRIAGSYMVSGAEVVFTSWGAEGDCPAELADQDSRVISALEGGFRVEIEEGQMTTWVAGDEGLIYRAES